MMAIPLPAEPLVELSLLMMPMPKVQLVTLPLIVKPLPVVQLVILPLMVIGDTTGGITSDVDTIAIGTISDNVIDGDAIAIDTFNVI